SAAGLKHKSIHTYGLINQEVPLIVFAPITAQPAGRHRNGTCAKRLAAVNSAWSITNDVDLACGEFPPMLLFCTGASEAPELVAVTMIIGKSAKFKKVPDAIMLKLEPRSARNISCEKREHHMRPRL